MDFDACAEREDSRGGHFRCYALDGPFESDVPVYMRFRRHAVARVGVSVDGALIARMEGRRWMRLVRRPFTQVRRHEAVLHVAVRVWRRACVPEGIGLSSAVGHCCLARSRRRLA